MLVPVPDSGKIVEDLDADPRLTARQLAHVAERLRDLRGPTISQRELARRTGLSPRTIGQIEQGRHEPRLGTMLALRRALGVASIEELIGPMPSTVLESIGQDLPAASHSSTEQQEIA
jgi:transcriptional regulator with XRE-family HTH domain